MKLQVAIDLLSTSDALTLLHKVGPYVDVIELGTPLVKQEGLSVVKYVKAAYPDKLVFADLKTMDTGELEAGMRDGESKRASRRPRRAKRFMHTDSGDWPEDRSLRTTVSREQPTPRL